MNYLNSIAKAVGMGYIELTKTLWIQRETETDHKMNGILYDARKIKVYEGLKQLCAYAGFSEDWSNRLWEILLTDGGLYREFVYYLEHHSLLDEEKVWGYGLTDLFIWQMDRSNLFLDTGKNTAACNKEAMILQAFYTMADMKSNPEYYLKKIQEGPGMDRTE